MSNPLSEIKTLGMFNLNHDLIPHPESTFFVRVSADMEGLNMRTGDILVVDSAIEADDGDVVIVRLGNELNIKRLTIDDNDVWFEAVDDAEPHILVSGGMYFEIFGKVTYSVRALGCEEREAQ